MRRDLIAWVGHDLSAPPLTSIRAILEAQADGMVDDPETRCSADLQTAQKDIRSLSVLIDDLFEMSQLDAGGLKLNCDRARSPT
jgi:signal transduction histidine kinase